MNRKWVKGLKMGLVSLLLGALACQSAPKKGAAPPPAAAKPEATSRGHKVEAPYDAAYLGVNFKVEGDGLRVDYFYPGTPASEAGIQSGDLILSLDGEPVFETGKEKTVDAFIEKIRTSPLGRVIHLKVLRGKAGGKSETVILEAKLRRREYNPGNKFLPPDRVLHPEWEGSAPGAAERIADRLIAHYGLAKEQQQLRQWLSDLTIRGDVFRIPEISYVLRNPFRNADAAEQLLGELKPLPRDSPAEAGRRLIEEARHLLNPERVLAPDAASSAALRLGLKPEAHLDQLQEVLSQVGALWKKAFERLSAEELDFMNQHAREFTDVVRGGGYVASAPTQEEFLKRVRMIELAGKVDYDRLSLAALSLLRVSEPAFVRGLKHDLEKAGLKLAQPVVLNRKTPFGEIEIAGTTDDWHKDLSEREVAILIDLGGDDFYSGAAGASTRKLHASIVVDLEGDDTYRSNTDYAQGAGFLGIGILADLAGDDTYVGQAGAQGASFAGVGLLVDAAGDDVYRAQALAQGSGFWGIAGLIDLAGDDRYESHLLSQGVGIAGGIGALLDARGDDQYYATGFYGSEYGTPGTFNGLSQGVGFGLRGLASGGLGILYDGGGSDRYEGGDFSQGGGYYFGWGILKDDGREDDVYIGSRYNQGFAAHCGVGTFIEQGGNDRYRSIDGVASGLSMDLSTSWFEDRGGNDRHEAKEFSLGSSAHNALTVYIDRGGKKSYVGPIQRANAQGNYYHGGSSFSLVLSEGALRDALAARDDYVFVLDSKGPFEHLAKPGLLESIAPPLKKFEEIPVK